MTVCPTPCGSKIGFVSHNQIPGLHPPLAFGFVFENGSPSRVVSVREIGFVFTMVPVRSDAVGVPATDNGSSTADER